MSAQALTSLAILKVQWDDGGHDYVDNFVPFVAEALRTLSADQVSVEELQQTLKNRFRLGIPQGAITTLLKRAERKGSVHRDHGVYVRNLAALPSDFEVTSERVSRQQRSLLSRLVSFAKERHGLQWTEVQAEEALIAQLQVSAVPLLASLSTGAPVPQPADSTRVEQFVTSSFVVHLDREDPDGFRCLETVVKGYTLAAALFLPDIGKTRQRFADLTVYVDTQLILRAIGLEGDRFKTASVELLDLLYRMNVDLACFSITFDEVTGILDAAQHTLRDPRHNTKQGLFAVYEHLVATGARASDVEMMIANLERTLNKLHIKVKTVPEHTAVHGISETRLDEILTGAMPNQREEAKRHDIGCIAAIHRLRGGRLSSDIESCRFMFVTTNAALARAATGFFGQEYDRRAAPLCVSDQTMATLAWVKNPEHGRDLSIHRFIAESYAALNPGNDLWRKYCDEISKLQASGELAEDDYHLLRFSTVARSALLDATNGDPDAFVTGTVPEILERAHANARKETEEQLRRERAARDLADQEGSALRKAYETIAASQRDRVIAIGRTLGQVAGWLVYAFTAAAVVIVVVLGIAPDWTRALSDQFPWLFWGVLGVGAAASIAGVLHGFSVRRLARRVEVATSELVSKRLAGAFAIDIANHSL